MVSGALTPTDKLREKARDPDEEAARALLETWGPAGSGNWWMPVHLEQLAAFRREAREQGRREGIEAVKGCRLVGPAPIGPLFGVGWDAAINAALNALRALKEAKVD